MKIKFYLLLTIISLFLAANSLAASPFKTYHIGILIFEGVETLDVTGPLEVFDLANGAVGDKIFKVYTIAINKKALRTAQQLKIFSDFCINDFPPIDILLIPGGRGINKHVLNNPQLMAWIKQQTEQANLIVSVCAGALVLGQLGLLDGLSATTHHLRMKELALLAPKTHILSNIKFVDNGRILLSAGITSGIDLSLHIVKRLAGKKAAIDTAQDLEYGSI